MKLILKQILKSVTTGYAWYGMCVSENKERYWDWQEGSADIPEVDKEYELTSDQQEQLICEMMRKIELMQDTITNLNERVDELLGYERFMQSNTMINPGSKVVTREIGQVKTTIALRLRDLYSFYHKNNI